MRGRTISRRRDWPRLASRALRRSRRTQSGKCRGSPRCPRIDLDAALKLLPQRLRAGLNFVAPTELGGCFGSTSSALARWAKFCRASVCSFLGMLWVWSRVRTEGKRRKEKDGRKKTEGKRTGLKTGHYNCGSRRLEFTMKRMRYIVPLQEGREVEAALK